MDCCGTLSHDQKSPNEWLAEQGLLIGIAPSTLLTLIVIPAVYGLVKGVRLAKTGRTKPTAQETVSAHALKGAST